MYPNIPPRLNLKETISSPTDPAKVIGFAARNMMMGVPSIVLKESEVVGPESDRIEVPTDVVDKLEEEKTELIILNDDGSAQAMSGPTFEAKRRLVGVGGGGNDPKAHVIEATDDAFRSFGGDEVRVNAQ
jgi:hypothetical protein